ncbi:MAG: 23S rRNA (guanosine(2251)-2'-O)-methyltransferase RlmB [Erysipelothrix sp.]|jgi:23S rRNA (guanosine2251-2'-O)-methyltransferase|nr:23S rRNA (guanosine(2251)-2'-O)-methyltransferase RlmB [Erysipelothrix sp.]
MKQYLYGRNPVKERLSQKKVIHTLYIQKGSDTANIENLAREQNIPVVMLDKGQVKALVGDANHQGVIAHIPNYAFSSLNTVLEDVKDKEHSCIIVADGLEDPHNLGAILRIADGAGVDAVIFGKHRSVSLTSTVAKVSAGAIESVKIIEVVNISQTLRTLKDAGFWIYGTEVSNAIDYTKASLKGKVVIVVGSEGQGMSSLVKKQCDVLLSIPMHGHVDSLNVSVACGILVYEVLRQRSKG